MRAELLAATFVKRTSSGTLSLGVFLLGHETDPENAEGAAEAVHRRRFERIVDLELEQELGGEVNDEGAERTADEGGPRFRDGATGGDGDETRENTVAHGDQVPDVVQLVVQEHGCHTTSGGGERRVDGTAGHSFSVGDDAARGARVEAVPAEPEDEGAENDERGGVARHRVHATIGSKATGARTDDHGAHQTSETTNHVDDARAGEVVHANVSDLVAQSVASAQPARATTPGPVHDDRVHEGGEEERVAEVRLELGAFGDRARHDRRRRSGERPLEQVHRQFARSGDVLHREVTGTDERVFLLSGRRPERETVAKQEPRDGADARVEHVFNQNVLRVLASHGSGAQHREAGLHEEHQEGVRQHKVDIDVITNSCARAFRVFVSHPSAYA